MNEEETKKSIEQATDVLNTEDAPLTTGEELIQSEPPVVEQPPQNQAPQTTPQATSKPQVVKVEKTKEVIREVSNNQQQANKKTKETSPAISPEENANKPRKKGTTIFAVILIVFLLAFVFFLPQIVSYVTDYKNKKNADVSMKNGVITCTMTRSTQELDYTVETKLTYQKNRLKATKTTTTNRLSDQASDNKVLAEHQQQCEKLKTSLSKVKGLSASCQVSAVMQKTIQEVDYKVLDKSYLEDNIAEFDGFYPEYELDDNVTALQDSLKQAGYSCTNVTK